MRRLLVSSIAAVALLFPATSAFAEERLPVGTSPCPSGRGIVVWHWDAQSGYTYVEACF